jgi:hypothetical protein
MKPALIALALLLTACDSTGPSGARGLWQLGTINERALPFELIAATSSTPAFSITGAEYNLNADGTYEHSVQFGPNASFVEFGTYTFDGRDVRLIAHQNRPYSMPLNGRSLTGTVEGRRYLYAR